MIAYLALYEPLGRAQSGAMSKHLQTDGTAYMVAGGLIMGTLGVFLEQAGQHPLTAVFFRCLFGAAALAFFALLSRRVHELRPNRRGMALAGVTGLLMTAMWATFFAAIQWTSIAMATVTFHLQPVWLMLAGGCLLGERLGATRLLALAAALLGLTLATGLLQADWPKDQPLFGRGLALAVFGSVCYAAVSLIAKQQRALSSLALTFWQCAFGGLLLAWWPLVHGLPVQYGDGQSAVWAWLIGLGVIHTGLAYVLIYSGMQRLPAGRIALLQFVYPISAILLDATIYGHLLSRSQWAGVLLMGVALWWAGRPPVQGPSWRWPRRGRRRPR